MNKRQPCDRMMHDRGPQPTVFRLCRLAKENRTFRTAVWTGEHLQVTVMCIPVGGEIGLEMHDTVDQLICVQEGCALLQTGTCRESLTHSQKVPAGCTVMIPACTCHNLVNIGHVPLKLYSVYAPPEHPFGTVHCTKAEADAAE